MQTSWLVLAVGVFVFVMALFSFGNVFRIPVLIAQHPHVSKRTLTLMFYRDAGFRFAIGVTCLTRADEISGTLLGAAFSIALAIHFLFDGLLIPDPRVPPKVPFNLARWLPLAAAGCLVAVAYGGLRVA